jgi:O-antigen chain-terminating methyltransferase
VLDVDGQVIAADVLVQRVEALLGQISPSALPAPAGQPAAGPALDAPIHAMRVIHGQISPPDLSGAAGLRGRGGRLVKKAVRKLTSWYVEPRWVLQQGLDAQAIEFAAQAYNNVARVDAELEDLRRQNARLKLQLVAANERASRSRYELGEVLTGAVTDIDGLTVQVAGAARVDEVQPLAKEVSAILERLGAAGTTGADINYVEFEDRFRGEDGELEASQERYLSLFPAPGGLGRIVDIGCGRGEMLTLLQKEGYDVIGVDLDQGMVDLCRSRGLPVVKDDGIHFLSQTPDDSLRGIFCAQVVEHLITPELEQLVRLAYRTLMVGGVLLMETINPRSSFALGNHFYADTSHVRPVHPETLRFICEQVGFTRVQLEERSPHATLALQSELPESSVGQAVTALLDSVFGYQDYAIVATK